MLKVADIFGDHMVLQRDQAIAVFGTSLPDAAIRVQMGDIFANTRADANGVWRCDLPARAAGTGYTLSVSGDGEEFRYIDIAIGDVYFAGGQSNMEYYMKFDAEYLQEKELLQQENPNIRFYDVPKISWEGEQEIYDYSAYGKWRMLSAESLEYCSAVAYYFMKTIQPEVQIPVAVVCCSWGGSNSSAWLPKEDIRKAGGNIWLECYENGLKQIHDLEGAIQAYKKAPRANPAAKLFDPDNQRMMYPGFSREEQQKLVQSNQVQNRPILPCDPWRPSGLYQYMIKPLIPYAWKGILWYQGESDSAHPEVFEGMFRQNILRLRQDFGENLPVLFVQLAPFRAWLNSKGDKYPLLRAAQQRVGEQVRDTWMVSSGDAGMEWDIHPKYKRKIGERLALLALGHIYQRDILCDAPCVEQVICEKNQVRITFANVQNLHINGCSVNAIEILDEKGVSQEKPEKITVIGNKLIFDLKKTPEEGWRIAFAQTPYYEINLYNESDIPVLPFNIMIHDYEGK